MNFGDAVKSVFSQYAEFSGRARRSEYWYFALFTLIVDIAITIIDNVIGTGIPGILVGLALLLPSLAVGIRRLHDTDRTGWWLFIALIPLVGAILLIVWLCQDSKPGTNRYGASPKEAGGYAGGGQPMPGYGA